MSKKNKIIVIAVVALVVVGLIALAFLFNSNSKAPELTPEQAEEEFSYLMDEAENRAFDITENANALNEQGLVPQSFMDKVKTINDRTTYLRNRFNDDSLTVDELNTRMNELISLIDECEEELTEYTGTGLDLKTFASELLNNGNSLKNFVDKALASKTIDNSRVAEFNDRLSRLEAIVNNSTASGVTKAELEKIKEFLGALASQVSATKEVIDNISNTVAGNSVSENKENKEPVKSEMPTDIAKLINDFNNLQNEASKKVENGTITQEEYMDLLSKGIQIASIKEKFEKNGLSDALLKEANAIKPYLYTIAEKMNSTLKNEFK